MNLYMLACTKSIAIGGAYLLAKHFSWHLRRESEEERLMVSRVAVSLHVSALNTKTTHFESNYQSE